MNIAYNAERIVTALVVDSDYIGTRLNKIVYVSDRIGDHKMHVKDHFAVLAERRNYRCAEADIKSRFPHLKIGGPASCGDEEWSEAFLKEIKKLNTPLDFFIPYGKISVTKEYAQIIKCTAFGIGHTARRYVRG